MEGHLCLHHVPYQEKTNARRIADKLPDPIGWKKWKVGDWFGNIEKDRTPIPVSRRLPVFSCSTSREGEFNFSFLSTEVVLSIPTMVAFLEELEPNTVCSAPFLSALAIIVKFYISSLSSFMSALTICAKF